MGKHHTVLELANGTLIIESTVAPEGAVAAPPSSKCHVTTTGKEFRKATGTGNTGWVELPGQVEKVAFAATGTWPIPFITARSLAAPQVLGNGSAPTVAYRYAATPGGAITTITVWPHAAAAGSWVLVDVTNMGTSALVTVAFSTS